MQFRGTLYRAINPIYARDPLSGQGAARYGGRFNPKGVCALYTALSPETAIKESNQVGTLQPTTLVAYDADIAPIFDATDHAYRSKYAISESTLYAHDWRDQMKQHGKAPTQVFAERLIANSYAGMQVSSVVRGATASDRNLVLWMWGDREPTRLTVIDNENRLARVYDR